MVICSKLIERVAKMADVQVMIFPIRARQGEYPIHQGRIGAASRSAAGIPVDDGLEPLLAESRPRPAELPGARFQHLRRCINIQCPYLQSGQDVHGSLLL
jgi:hypothetical protein